MPVVGLTQDVYCISVVDWSMRTFHGHTYNTNRGTTYNAYLIIDDKVTLIDAVYGPFAKELIDDIRKIIPLEKIDYIVVNHVEIDHSGALPEVIKLCPKAKIFGTLKCKEGLEKHYYGNWDFNIVKTGDELKLGKKTLTFIEAPMIHWPDSMFTYLGDDQILFPNDAFGQHYATSERFDDEVDQCALMDEATKYYANILWPLGSVILKKIQDIQKMNIAIKIIAPSHGVIWRKDPAKIINAYLNWTKDEVRPKVVVVYETMWKSTEKMARKIVKGIEDSGLSVKLFDLNMSDRTEVIKEMLDAKGFMFGSSTHDNGMLTTIVSFLHFLKGLKPRNRLAAVFGSYGWAGGAVKDIEDVMKETGITLAQPALSIKYVPNEQELKQCYEFGKSFAKQIK